VFVIGRVPSVQAQFYSALKTSTHSAFQIQITDVQRLTLHIFSHSSSAYRSTSG